MTEVIISLTIFTVFIGIILVIRWLIRIPVSPDPWDKEIDKQDFNASSIPVCLKCTKPVENPNQHYCPHCGNVTGEYTRYVPFVNIRFNYSIFESLWEKSNSNKTIFPVRMLYFFLIIVFAPIMIIVGIPVGLYYFMKRNIRLS